ncbi:MAG TPA: hypothetical protein VLE47_04705 [Candidatus Saccharimonadales bacterium]|nr:hypothetical protein [Candidatus Saccharimonadales bacterium]
MDNTISSKIVTSSAKDIVTPQIVSVSYWIATPSVGSLNHWGLALLAALSTLVLIFVLVLLGIKLLNSSLSSTKQKFLTKAIWSLIAFGPIGWLLILSRLYGIVFFSARFWWVIWFACLIAVCVYLYRNYRKIPAKEHSIQTYQLKKRYFPKKKR